MIVGDAQRAALDIAVRAVTTALRGERRWLPDVGVLPASLREPGASFVTLTDGESGRLRGCIGTLLPRAALGVDIARNAAAAAFDDPRMPPVVLAELERLHVEVSVLTVPTRLEVTCWTDLQHALRPGLDGVLVEAPDGRRATLLPTVWVSLPEAGEFVTALWRKAGLQPGEWPAGLAVSRYGALVFGGDARDHGAVVTTAS